MLTEFDFKNTVKQLHREIFKLFHSVTFKKVIYSCDDKVECNITPIFSVT